METSATENSSLDAEKLNSQEPDEDNWRAINASQHLISGADPGFFSGVGALVSCSTSTPINHIVFVFFCRIPVVLENGRSSQGGGGGGGPPPAPPPPPPPPPPRGRTPCTLPLDPPLNMMKVHFDWMHKYNGFLGPSGYLLVKTWFV